MNDAAGERKISRAILIVSGLTILALGGCKKPPVEGPSVVFEDADCEIGQLPRGIDTINHDFVFMNVGNRPLKIYKVTTQCSCVTTKIPNAPVPRGGKAVISVQFTLARVTGPQRTSVLVSSNDLAQPVRRLMLTASVSLDIAISADKIDLGWISAGNSAESRFFIVIPCENDEAQSDLVTVTTSSPNLRVAVLDKKTRVNQWDGLVQVVTCTAQYTAGQDLKRIDERIFVRHNNKTVERQIVVHGKVLGRVRVEPESIYLSTVKGHEPIEKTAAVYRADGNPLNAKEIVSSCKAIRVEKRKATESRLLLYLTIHPEMLPAGVIREEVLVTMGVTQPPVRIAVFGWKSTGKETDR